MLLNKLDWNLLKALRVLLEHQSVTGAAQELGVTQSAMSHSLKRIREYFNDPILVNSAQGMMMTDRAKELQATLSQSLQLLEGALASHGHFDPQNSTATIRILLHDYCENILVPALLPELLHKAPNIQLDLITGHRADDKALAQGDIHLMVGADVPQAGHFRQKRLWKDRLVIVAHENHPRLTGNTLTTEQFAAETHVFITKTGVGGGPMDDWLKGKGMKRHKAIITRHFHSALYHVANSDIIVTLPLRVFQQNDHLPIKAMTFSEESAYPDWSVLMTWAPITHEQPIMKWFRDLVVKATKDLPALDE